MSLRRDLRTLPTAAWILCAGALVNRFGSFVLVFLALYLKRRGYSVADIGLTMGAYGVGSVVASMVGGHLADTIGRRNTIALSMLSSAVVIMALSQAETYALLMVFTALAGATSELYRPAAAALLTDLTVPEQRVTAFAVYRLGINLGFALGPAVGVSFSH